MRASMKVMLLMAAFLIPTLSAGQECEAAKDASVEKIIEYLQHVGDDPAAAACVQVAFHHIAALPPEQAIPLLITYLGYKRPLNESERHGFFMHGKAPDVLFPAVQELYSIGSPADPALIGFIAGNKDSLGLESKNAVYTLLLIHHGDVVSALQELHRARVSLTSDDVRDRLQAAAREAMNGAMTWALAQCEDALK